jgi:hypothetical protein
MFNPNPYMTVPPPNLAGPLVNFGGGGQQQQQGSSFDQFGTGLANAYKKWLAQYQQQQDPNQPMNIMPPAAAPMAAGSPMYGPGGTNVLPPIA